MEILQGTDTPPPKNKRKIYYSIVEYNIISYFLLNLQRIQCDALSTMRTKKLSIITSKIKSNTNYEQKIIYYRSPAT